MDDLCLWMDDLGVDCRMLAIASHSFYIVPLIESERTNMWHSRRSLNFQNKRS